MIDVFVTVNSAIRQVGDDEDQTMVFSTEGKLEKNGELTKLIYEETEISGLEGTKTAIIIDKGVVRLKRYGSSAVEFVFEKGKIMNTLYKTQYGDFDMTIKPIDIEINIDEVGKGQLHLDYHLLIKGLAESRNILSITIQ